jgi:CO/xanthine dehydrogenase Mo-binding subunit
MTGAMRGFGAPQVCFAYESHMDDMAKALEIDPLEMRLMNVLEEGSLSPTEPEAAQRGRQGLAAAGGHRFGWNAERERRHEDGADAASPACGTRSASPSRPIRAPRW